jgi:hypothetical protein
MNKKEIREPVKETGEERKPLKMPRSFLVGEAPEPRRITPRRPLQ